jgi:bifunctional DNA-binding transcriptional regulator/antitoxin component of YhaV-PrlF toxin-antitoxin module
MSKVTSKLQVTLPKAIADRYSIAPGDEIARLKLFDQSTVRQRLRQKDRVPSSNVTGRGWTREDLYNSGRTP